MAQAHSQKLRSFVQNCGPFQQSSGLLNKFVAFSSKIVNLLFESVVLLHLENPLATGL